MMVELTPSEARYVRDSIHARAHLIRQILPDCADVAERLQLEAQIEHGAGIVRRLDVLLQIATKENSPCQK